MACSKSVKIGFSIPINGVIWSSINVCKYNPPATDETVLKVKHIKTDLPYTILNFEKEKISHYYILTSDNFNISPIK